MSFKINCPHCAKTLNVTEPAFGKTVSLSRLQPAHQGSTSGTAGEPCLLVTAAGGHRQDDRNAGFGRAIAAECRPCPRTVGWRNRRTIRWRSFIPILPPPGHACPQECRRCRRWPKKPINPRSADLLAGYRDTRRPRRDELRRNCCARRQPPK